MPSILSLPTASIAARCFSALKVSAATHLRTLSIVSSTSFLAAFYLSPRCQRHPYLLYVSLLTLASSVVDRIAPRVPDGIFHLTLPACLAKCTTRSAASQPDLTAPPQASSASAPTGRRPARRLDQSYEVLGDAQSDATSAGSPEDVEDEGQAGLNGEEVRGGMDAYLKARILQTAVSAAGFVFAIVGIWGDRIAPTFQTETIVFAI